MIVDAHVHALGRPGRDVLAETVRQCRLNGVSAVLVSLGDRLYAYPSSEQIVRSNDAACRFVRDSGGLGHLLAHLSPQDPRWREELDRCVNNLGAVGVKLWCSFKDPDGGMGNVVPLLRECGRRGLPVLMHTFQKTCGNLPGEITLPEFAALAEAAPDTQMIGAHAGGNWRHSLGVLADRLPNAHVDCGGFFPEQTAVAALTADLGAERVLFGSDLIGNTQAGQMAKVVFADIPDAEKALVLGGNAARLFGLQDVPPGPAGPLRPLEDLPDASTEHFCFVGAWPYYEGPWVTAQELDGLLAAAGIETAYTGDFATLFRQDLERANSRFLEAAAGCGRIAPLATLNPLAHNWRSTLRRLRDGFAGVLVFPYMHNWQLDAPEHADFFRALADARLPVWINCALADDRARHSGLASRPVTSSEVVSFCRTAPANDYVFQGLGGHVAAQALAEAADAARLRFEVSRLTDSTFAWDDFVNAHGRDNLVMGSEFPLRHLQETRWAARRT